MDKQITKRQIDAFRNFMLKLIHLNDATLIILKGHLLVEQQLRLLVDNRVESPKCVAEANLDCFQIICLAEAFCGNNPRPQIWNALRKLNKLRNDIAHNIEVKGLNDKMRHIIALVEENTVFEKSEINKLNSTRGAFR